MGSPDLSARPLGLAETIDRSIAVGRRHFRALFLAMLVVQVPALLLARRAPGLEMLAAATDPDRAAQMLGRAFREFALLFLSLLALQLVATAAAAAIVEPSLDPRRGIRRPSRPRVLAAVAVSTVLQVVILAAAPVAGALPGIALALRAESVATYLAGAVGAAVGGLGLFLVAMLRLVLAPAAAAVEGKGFGALARSFHLMSPRRGSSVADRPGVRASLVLLAIFVLAVAVSALSGLPRMIAARAVGGPGGLGVFVTQLPLPLEIAVSVFEAAAGAAVQPFSMVAVVVLYYDRRARTEGLDLELWAERLEAPR
jgi:hypothetical protein